MQVSMIRFLYEYNDWANDLMIHALEKLQEEVHSRPAGSTASLRDRFAHIAGAEWIWLQRWKGDPPSSAPDWSQTGNIRDLAVKLQEVRDERNRILDSLSDSELDRRQEFRNLKGDTKWNVRIGEMLTHVANHSTYHRGQIASMARQMGFAPPSTDLIFFAAKE